MSILLLISQSKVSTVLCALIEDMFMSLIRQLRARIEQAGSNQSLRHYTSTATCHTVTEIKAAEGATMVSGCRPT
jgi:hypothetical protein